jgi:hypothetical protein
MNVEIGTEAAQFPEKEYVNGIFVANDKPKCMKYEPILALSQGFQGLYLETRIWIRIRIRIRVKSLIRIRIKEKSESGSASG